MLLPLTLPVADAGMPPAGPAGMPDDGADGFGAALDVALDQQAGGDLPTEADASSQPQDDLSAASEGGYVAIDVDLPASCVVTLPVLRPVHAAEVPEGEWGTEGTDIVDQNAPDASASSAVSVSDPSQNVAAIVATVGSARKTEENGAASMSAVEGDGRRSTQADGSGRQSMNSAAEAAGGWTSDPAGAAVSEAGLPDADAAGDDRLEETALTRPSAMAPAGLRRVQSGGQQDGVDDASTRVAAATVAPVGGPTEPVPPAMPGQAAGNSPVQTADAVTDLPEAGAQANLEAAEDVADIEVDVVETGASTGTNAGSDTGTSRGSSEQGSSSTDTGSGSARPSGQAAMVLVQSADGTLRLAHVGGTAQAPATPTMSPEERAENVTRLVQTMRVMTKDGVSEATIRLRPEHLGEVSIAVRVEGKTVTATVQAESQGVREWLQSQEESLRSNLSQQGLSLDKLQVQRDGKQDRRGHPQHEHQPRPRYRRPEDVEARFEVSA